MNSRLYLGHVMHTRVEPVAHSFRYPAFVFALDVDELETLDRRLRLFGHNRGGVFSLRDGDYLGDPNGTLRAKLAHHIAAAGAVIALDRIELVTTPRVVGHAFNPVSFYYCYADDGTLAGIVTEVNNTFGEAHVYVLPAHQATNAAGPDMHFVAPKRFHVSPFNDMSGSYDFRFAPLGEQLDVRIDIQRDHGKTFASRLRGTARPLDDKALSRLAATYPLTAALTLPRIMWQAYKLHFRRGLPVVAKPTPSSPQTYGATRPAYISEFSAPAWLRRLSSRSEMRGSNGSH